MRIILILFLIFFRLSGFCQSTFDISLLEQKYTLPAEQHSHNVSQLKNTGNEVEFIITGSFLFYKEFISSQDISSCNFTPSCSEYALQAVNSQGIIVGVINFLDRFTRCNGLNAENYSFSKDKKLLSDPVRNIKGEIIKDE